MGDDADDTEDEPAVELGPAATVEGAPLARVASRLTWPITASEVREKEGDATIRTPDGPQTVGEALDAVDDTYFDDRGAFVTAVRDAVGAGPVPSA
jgi:hypothetical protein